MRGDCWADITTPDGTTQVADAAAILLHGLAACPSLTPPSALTPNLDLAPAGTPGPGRAQEKPGHPRTPRPGLYRDRNGTLSFI
jgi:hypothetical protein